MWAILTMLGLSIGGYIFLSYRESMLAQEVKPIQQERIKHE